LNLSHNILLDKSFPLNVDHQSNKYKTENIFNSKLNFNTNKQNVNNNKSVDRRYLFVI